MANTVKFMFSQKATKIDEIFTIDLTLCSQCQIDSEDFINFCGLLRKYELYYETELFFLFGLLSFYNFDCSSSRCSLECTFMRSI